ncbi:MAG: glycosyl transferase [Candidatus Tectimicrobiota bacterium]|nr:MAG: glycosyl transferase [Candidatus Tectomicrobia bacterium]
MPEDREKDTPRVLLMRSGAIGDWIVTLPVLAALRQAFPQAWIEVLGQSERAVLACHPCYAQQVTDLARWDVHRLFAPQAAVSREFVAYLARFTLVVAYLPAPDLEASLRRYCPGTVVHGTPRPATRVHVTEHLFQPLAPLVAPPPQWCPRVYLAPEAEAAAARFWRAHALPTTGVVAVHPGSGGPFKLWPLEGWRQLLAWLRRQGLMALLVSGPAEPPAVAALAAEGWPQARHLPLPLLAALLARCQAFVGHDSGITHLAAAVGTPVLALFGPTDPLVWGPRSPRACVLHPPAPAPLTLDALPAAVVIDTLAALLEGTFVFTPSAVDCTLRVFPA